MLNRTVYIGEDHKILRDGLKLILSSSSLDLKVIGESGDGKIVLEEVLKLKPDILLLDISMPSMLGVDVAREVFKEHKECKIIVLTKHANPEYLKRLLKFKIAAYILKDDAATDLVKALQSLDRKIFYISPKLSSKFNISDLDKDLLQNESTKKFVLTKRELEIVKLIAENKRTEDIATFLNISAKTVKAHRTNIFTKLEIDSLTELVKYAIRNNLIDL